MTRDLTPQQIDRINAAFAEHVLEWMAVGLRRRGVSGSTYDHDVYEGVPSRVDNLTEVPRAWYRLEEAMKGFDHLPPDAGIVISRVARHANWCVDIILASDYDETRFRHDTSRYAHQNLSSAIVGSLLRLVGYQMMLPYTEEDTQT